MQFRDVKAGQFLKFKDSPCIYLKIMQPPAYEQHPYGEGCRNAVDVALGAIVGIDPNAEVINVKIDIEPNRVILTSMDIKIVEEQGHAGPRTDNPFRILVDGKIYTTPEGYSCFWTEAEALRYCAKSLGVIPTAPLGYISKDSRE